MLGGNMGKFCNEVKSNEDIQVEFFKDQKFISAKLLSLVKL